MMMPVLLITLVAFVSQVSPNVVNINVDQVHGESQGSSNIDVNVNQNSNPGNLIHPGPVSSECEKSIHEVFGRYTIHPFDDPGYKSQCLNGDTGAEVAEADVAGLTIYADADPPACTKYVDGLHDFLTNLTNRLRGHMESHHLDPLTLPSAHASFSKKIWFVTFHGDASAYNGYFRGLATVNLCGELTRDSENRVNGIKLSGSFKELKGHYDLEASFMFLEIDPSVTLEVDNPILSISASLDRTKCKLQVTELDIDIGHISLSVCGLGPLDWILDYVVDTCGKIAEGAIKGQGNLLKGLVNDVLDLMNMSIMKDIFECDKSATSQLETEIMFTTNPWP